MPSTAPVGTPESGATSALSAESVELVGGLDNSRVLLSFEARHEAVEDLLAHARERGLGMMDLAQHLDGDAS